MSDNQFEQFKVERRGGARVGAGRKPDEKSLRGRAARQAVQQLLDRNMPSVEGWLHSVADGLPKLNKEGEPLRDSQGSVVYVVKPDRAGAIKLLIDMADYVIPRLQRSDVAMVAKVETSFNPSTATAEQLQNKLMESLGLIQPADVIDVEPVEVVPANPPDWMKP